MGNVTSSKPVDLNEAIDMAQGLMYQVVQELGENSGDKQKWNGNHYTHNSNNTNNASNLNPNKCPETARVVQPARQTIRSKTAELHLVHKPKEDQSKEDREVMSLVSDVAKKDITKTSVQTMESRRWKSNSRQPAKPLEQSKTESREP
ncbi:hypothetical protein Tco_0796470 [Tanacetum coccineum]